MAGGDFDRAIRLAVNHSGDSDSTGAITGNLLGVLLGRNGLSDRWLTDLELKEEIEKMGLSLYYGLELHDCAIAAPSTDFFVMC